MRKARYTRPSTVVKGSPSTFAISGTVGSAPNGPEFTISWVPKVLEAREGGSDLIDVAQIFQRSGTLQVAFAESGIDTPEELVAFRHDLVRDASYQTTSVYGFGHPLYYDNVIKSLRGEAQPDTDGRAGRKSLELILGIYESAKTGREVPLPLRAQV